MKEKKTRKKRDGEQIFTETRGIKSTAKIFEGGVHTCIHAHIHKTLFHLRF